MNAFPIIVLAASLAFGAVASADWPNVPSVWVTASDNGRSMFKMVPAKSKRIDDKVVTEREAFGVAYSVSEDGELKELWRAEGWYGYRGHLTNDGRYLVRLGPPMQEGSIASDLAIAFYDQGKLLKEYKVGELLKDEQALVHTSSHYIWQPEKQTDPTGFFPGMNSHFHLVMADKTSYAFDVATGAIVDTGTDTGARNSHEIREEEHAKDAAKGQAVLAKSAFRKDYEEHFTISEAEVMRGSYSGCSLKGPTWTATLTPKNKLAHPAEVNVVFPIKDDRAEAALKPQEMIAAMEKAFQHPFVAERFKNGGATGLRMRTQGDRLHWDTPEIREFLQKTKGTVPEDGALKDWLYAIIDLPIEPRYQSFYLNSQTGELFYEDTTKWPWVPVLLDAEGKIIGEK